MNTESTAAGGKLRDAIALAIHEGLGESWAYSNYSGNEWVRCRDMLNAAADAVLAIPVVAEALRSAASPRPAEGQATPIEIDYTNYRGERSTRLILPTGRMVPGDPQFHPGAPWVIEAIDCAKAALRTFDPAHIHAWRPQMEGAPIFTEESGDAD